MKLTQWLELQRGAYLLFLARNLRKWPDAQPEHLLELDFSPPEQLYKLYRADMLRLIGEQAMLYDIEYTAPIGEPWLGTEAGVELDLNAFAWNSCTVTVLARHVDRGALVGWGTHWLDVDDSRSIDADGFRGVIHHVTPPSYPEGKFTLHIDWGSAPVRAVTEFIRVVGEREGKISFR